MNSGQSPPKNILLDLRLNSTIPLHIKRRLDDLYAGSREAYSKIFSRITEANPHSIDWLTSKAGSRDPIINRLYINLAAIPIVQEHHKSGRSQLKVVTDSAILGSLLKNLLNQLGTTTQAKISITVRGTFSRKLRNWYLAVRNILSLLFFYIHCRVTAGQRNQPPAAPLDLIDTFITPGYEAKNAYYGDLLGHLSRQERAITYFVPTFTGYRWYRIGSGLKLIRQQPNLLLKEDYLKVSDYLYALFHLLRIRKTAVPVCGFSGVDVTALMKENLREVDCIGPTVIGLLNFRFFRRLRLAGIQLRLAVDWFENQLVDRGWQLGIKKHYPKTASVGYQGFVSSQAWMNNFPINAEMDAACIPDNIAVTGPAVEDLLKKNCDRLKTETAPAFRHEHLFMDCEKRLEPERYTIIVALSQYAKESAALLEQVVGLLSELPNGCRVHIKEHPIAENRVTLPSNANSASQNITLVTEEPLNKLLDNADLFVSSSSSACMESLMKGVPVIIVASNPNLTLLPIPETIPQSHWRLCYTRLEILDAVFQFKSMQNALPGDITDLRERYYTPVTSGAVRSFLRL